MSAILIGAFVGMACGWLIGLLIAESSRAGIWPNVWAGITLAGGGAGMFLGLMSWLF